MAQLTEGDTSAPNRPQPDELAQSVLRTLALPDIVDLRPKLVPELSLYDLEVSGLAESALAGRADAIVLESERPSIVEMTALFYSAHDAEMLRGAAVARRGARAYELETFSPLFYVEATLPGGCDLAVPSEHEERAADDR